MPLSEENNWEKRLPNLPAYKKYKELDNVDIKDYNHEKCDKLAKSDDGDKILCKQILKNLSILNKKQGNEQKHGCFYFQNWLHEKINEKYYNGKNQSSKDYITNKLFDFVAEDISTNGINRACSGNSFGIPKTWKEGKDLYDYFENFEHIECNDSDRDECQKYVKYVTYIDPIYYKKTDFCCDEEELEPHCNSSTKCEYKYNTKELVDKLKKQLQVLDEKKAGTDAAAQEEENSKRAAASAAEAAETVAQEKELAAAGGHQAVRGETGALQLEPSLVIPPRDNPEHAVNAGTTYNSGISSDTGHTSLAVVPSTLERVSDKVDSNFIRNIIMAVAVLGTIVYLFYNSRSSRLEPSSRKRKQKKRLFEHNYYEEYEKELGMYDSEETFLNSEADRLHLNYYPDQDSYY